MPEIQEQKQQQQQQQRKKAAAKKANIDVKVPLKRLHALVAIEWLLSRYS